MSESGAQVEDLEVKIPVAGPAGVAAAGSPKSPAPKLDFKVWRCIYPAYIDSTRGKSGGRKIPLKDAVATPNVQEMAVAARSLNLPVHIENKRLPRDPYSQGRIRVRLLDSFGKPYSDALSTPLKVMKEIASVIKKARAVAEENAKKASAAAAASATASPAGKPNKKR